MSAITSEQTVGQLVAELPSRSRVFEEAGIDYCCGGKRPLTEACAKAGVSVDDIVARLEAVTPRSEDEADGPALTEMPLHALADHIVETHHGYLRTELPRITGLLEKVIKAHLKKEPQLLKLQEVFEELAGELSTHMLKEERVLFPAIRYLEGVGNGPEFALPSVRFPITAMEQEHDHAGDCLLRLREHSNDFTPPDWACNTFRALYDALRELEIDLHQHIHKENNILFPRAMALEASMLDRV